MKKLEYFVKGSINALGVVAYTSAVALFLSNGERIFGGVKSFLLPLFMLLLLIVSATITGLLVLGKPIQLYFNGLKKEAVTLLFTTLGLIIFFAIAVVVAILLS